jgi:hypothetical protein
MLKSPKDNQDVSLIRERERSKGWRMAYSQKEPCISKPPKVDSEDAIMVDEVGNRGSGIRSIQ